MQSSTSTLKSACIVGFAFLFSNRVDRRTFPSLHLSERYSNSTTSSISSIKPLLVILQCTDLSEDVANIASSIDALSSEISIYVTSTSGSFQNSSLWDIAYGVDARVVHCSPVVCDSVVFSLIAYEGYDEVLIVRLMDFNATSQEVISTIKNSLWSRSTSASSQSIGLFSCELIRQLMSSPCFNVQYKAFNVIQRIREESAYLNQEGSREKECVKKIQSSPVSNDTAVVLTAFKRDYFREVLTNICRQTIPPKLVLFIQNMAYTQLTMRMIPNECTTLNVQFEHVWLSNWNSFSFMRHYIPIPSAIRNTILVDDDMILKPDVFEKGLSTMHAHHCVATERGRLVEPNVNHKDWKMLTSAMVSNLTIVDYAFIPQFVDTEWRKHYVHVAPFSRRYGDILFMSSGLYRFSGITPCIIPHFDFFEKDEGDDSMSTSKAHSDEYNALYTGIAESWIAKGYVPVVKRSKREQTVHSNMKK